MDRREREREREREHLVDRAPTGQIAAASRAGPGANGGPALTPEPKESGRAPNLRAGAELR